MATVACVQEVAVEEVLAAAVVPAAVFFGSYRHGFKRNDLGLNVFDNKDAAMQQAEALDWFGQLSSSEKVAVLIGVMFELTIVIRSIFLDYAEDSAVTSRLAYSISELNHRLASAASSLLAGRATFPDDVLIEMMFESRPHAELERYFPFAFEQVAMRFINDHAKRD